MKGAKTRYLAQCLRHGQESKDLGREDGRRRKAADQGGSQNWRVPVLRQRAKSGVRMKRPGSFPIVDRYCCDGRCQADEPCPSISKGIVYRFPAGEQIDPTSWFEVDWRDVCSWCVAVCLLVALAVAWAHVELERLLP